MITHSRGTLLFNPLPQGKTSQLELRTANRPDIASCELTLQDPISGKIHLTVEQDLPADLPEGLGDAKKGRDIFNGKGCNYCHGYLGQIEQIPDESVATVRKMNPIPSNFRDPKTLRLTTDKQRFRVIKYGIPGTAMMAMTHISDDEIIDSLAYLRALRQEATGEP
jgi:cytochrome c